MRALSATSPAPEFRPRVVGTSPVMEELHKSIHEVGPHDVTVLILGESGTGKELVSRLVHECSCRSQGPLVSVNCAALSDSLLESELFGHERGAFTGAESRRAGTFEQADGGTVFLDEIGDMALPTQAKVLRVLQERSFTRLGGNQTVHSNFRLIAATNHDLTRLIHEQRFREDLYYRLKAATLRLPPLRERAGDLQELVHYFVQRFNHELGRSVRFVPRETMGRLARHSWPGNVRELENVLHCAMIRARGAGLTPDLLPPELCNDALPASCSDKADLSVRAWVRSRLRDGETDLYHKLLDETQRILFEEVLRHAGSQLRASAVLNLSRGTLRARLRQLGLAWS